MAGTKQRKSRLSKELSALRPYVTKLEARLARGKRTEAVLRSRTKELRGLRALAQRAKALPNVSAVLRGLVASAMDLVEARGGTAGVMRQNRMVFEEYNSNASLQPFDRAFDRGEGVPGLVMQTRRPYVCNDPAGDDRIPAEMRRKLGLESLANVPILSGSGKLLGCLEVHNRRGRRGFDDRDVEMLAGFADLGAVALKNTLLRERLKETRSALDDARAEIAAVCKNVPLITVLVDGSGRIRNANDAAAERAAAPERQIVGKRYGEALRCIHAFDDPKGCGFGPQCETCKVRLAVLETLKKGRRVQRLEAAVPVRKGHGAEEMFFLVFTAPMRLGRKNLALICLEDITDLKRAEEYQRKLESQIQQAQRVESLGVVAGSIAHDFNNLMVGILGYADLALMQLVQPSAIRESVEKLKQAATQASELTNQLLAYASKDRLVVRAVSLNKIVEEMARLLKVSIPRRITLTFSLAKNLPAIEANAQQVRQVVMNLITNASEAIGNSDGVITIRTGTTEVRGGEHRSYFLHEDLKEGRYVFLEVADTGCGMAKETKARMFEPFFTTKLAGRGLGLAAVLRVVKGHQGAIRVHSQLGKGTTVRALLHRARKGLGRLWAERETEPAATWRGRGTILIVDDESTVRDVAKTVLERSGFRVLTAANGREGVDLFRGHCDEVSAVLLDVTMPQLDGRDVLEEIRKIREDAKVVLTSGYAEDRAADQLAGHKIAGFIRKPFHLQSLLRKLREVIEEQK